eukprot:523711_1
MTCCVQKRNNIQGRIHPLWASSTVHTSESSPLLIFSSLGQTFCAPVIPRSETIHRYDQPNINAPERRLMKKIPKLFLIAFTPAFKREAAKGMRLLTVHAYKAQIKALKANRAPAMGIPAENK